MQLLTNIKIIALYIDIHENKFYDKSNIKLVDLFSYNPIDGRKGTFMQSKKHQFLAGLHAGIPIIIGFIPIGIAFAIMARQAGFTVLQTTGMSITVFAGASQMMAAGMTAQGAGDCAPESQAHPAGR